nr:HNH endonuclease family protein [Megamonas hypermegale]
MDYYDVFCYKLLSKTGKSRFQNNHDFREHFDSYDLYNAKSSMKKYILERLENFGNKELVAVEQLIDEKKLTIEHIMPQTLSDEWKQQLGKNWEIIKEKYLNTIGNLTLTAYNSNYSNLSFQKKKTMEEKGFSFSKLFLNDYIKKCDEWGERQIKKRADILYKKAEKIWWIPDVVEDNEIEKTEWINWDEDVDITSKKISQVEVMGTLMETKDMSDAYRKIHKSLFELEPTIYYKLDFAWFNQSKENMKRAYELSENAYIETNKSSQSKFNSIKKIAEAMQLDSNDIRLLMINKPIK